jgi:3-oxoacyl-[acyl-carrier-protein] synthase II
MRARHDIFITGAAAIRPIVNGVLDDSLLAKEKRSPKIGILPLKARMVLAAAAQCLPASQLAADTLAPDIGVSLGTAYGSMDVAELSLRTVYDAGFKHVVPSWYATGLPNATAAIIAALYKLGGPNLTLLGCQAGMDAIIHGCRQIANGRASTMLVGGFDMPSDVIGANLAHGDEDLAERAQAHWKERRSSAPIVEAGVGLLCLSNKAPASGALARVVGWAQQPRRANITEQAHRTALLTQAMAHAQVEELPQVHVIDQLHLERAGSQLAASAPIYLVQQVQQGQQGHERHGRALHAVLSVGIGQSDTCLLLEKA